MIATVLLAEADPFTRAGLKGVLDAHQRVQVVGAAASSVAALRLARELRPAVVVTAARIDDSMEAAELTTRLTRLGTAVLVLPLDHDKDTMVSCLIAGARGYLLRDCMDATLQQAVIHLAAGKAFLDPVATMDLLRLVTRTAYRARPVPVQRLNGLTARERQVLTALAEGMPPERIAAALSIAMATVRSHISHILRKLEVGTTLAAVAVANQAGLLEEVGPAWFLGSAQQHPAPGWPPHRDG